MKFFGKYLWLMIVCLGLLAWIFHPEVTEVYGANSQDRSSTMAPLPELKQEFDNSILPTPNRFTPVFLAPGNNRVKRSWSLKTGKISHLGTAANGYIYAVIVQETHGPEGTISHIVISPEGEVIEMTDMEVDSDFAYKLTSFYSEDDKDILPDGTISQLVGRNVNYITPDNQYGKVKLAIQDWYYLPDGTILTYQKDSDDIPIFARYDGRGNHIATLTIDRNFFNLDLSDVTDHIEVIWQTQRGTIVLINQKTSQLLIYNSDFELVYQGVPKGLDETDRYRSSTIPLYVSIWGDVWLAYPIYDQLGNVIEDRLIRIDPHGQIYQESEEPGTGVDFVKRMGPKRNTTFSDHYQLVYGVEEGNLTFYDWNNEQVAIYELPEGFDLTFIGRDGNLYGWSHNNLTKYVLDPPPVPTYRLTASSPTADNIEFKGHFGGTIEAAFVENNYVYIGEGPRLSILDITTPTSPTVVGQTDSLGNIVRDVAINGNYAYLANSYGGLRIVDITDPTSPTVVGSYSASQKSAREVTTNNYYAYLTYKEEIRIIDVSDPTLPVEVDRLYGSQVILSGNYTYMTDENYLWVLDSSDATDSVDVGAYRLLEPAEDIILNGHYIYIVGMKYLQVVDISDPVNPIGVGDYDLSKEAVNVTVHGNYLYALTQDPVIEQRKSLESLQVIDVSDPAHPVEVEIYDIPGDPEQLATSKGYAYIAANDSFWVMDISDPTELRMVGSYSAEITPYQMAISGSYAYVANGWDLRVVDISEPGHPVVVTHHEIPGGGWYIVINREHAYVSGSKGLHVIDISSPTDLSEVGAYQISGGIKNTVITDNYAYGENSDGLLLILDISDPTDITKAGSYETEDFNDITVVDSYVYLGGRGNLTVVDVSDPTHPVEITNFSDNNSLLYWDITISDHYAYIAGYRRGWGVLDLSNPTDIAEVAYYDTGGFTQEVNVTDNHVYIEAVQFLQEDTRDLLWVMNKSDPPWSAKVSYYELPAYQLHMVTKNNYIYMLDGQTGLTILQNTTATADAN